MPLFFAACRAVSNKVTQVKRAFAPEFFNWYSSSAALYAALAGDWMPPKRCVAHANGSVSICRILVSSWMYQSKYAYRVDGEDSDDFVPLGCLVWMEAELL